MRRPHVYERSVPRGRRPAFQEPGLDEPAPDVARQVAEALPALIRTAQAGGLATLARLLTLAKDEAERPSDAGPATSA